MLELDQVERVAGQNEQVDLMPAAAVVAELEIGPGPEWGSVGEQLLDDVQALLLVGKLRIRDGDPTAVLHQ